MSRTGTPPLDRPAATRAGALVCGAVLTAANLVTGFATVTAYRAGPAGPWDHEGVTHVKAAAGLGVGCAVLTLLLTLVCVKARWLRSAWWYAVPAALGAAALLRLTVLLPHT
ncbi:hypothetical protein GTW43_09445 [Streptomyces sp. SID5785]|uniref:hypothetical protein n=1 Tax=Streptomyces sp. SID5785 TaxID=2690309 RepID=UPI001361B660|nr:hypothetical protein [Streptomyces sp. SID5785]MZD05304.1 hypothetical protein [Streptomyces sp. SID5785]